MLKETFENSNFIRGKTILNPYIILFNDPKNSEKTKKMMTSKEYKAAVFELNLIGSDEVICAYNSLMNHVYESEKTGHQDGKELLRLWGALLLEIRKSLGNKKSGLNEFDMIRGMIKGVDDL